MIIPLKKYPDFSGRARRREHWFFYLLNVSIFGGLAFLAFLIGDLLGDGRLGLYQDIWLIGVSVLMAIFIPSLALTFRRVHDANLSGWLILFTFRPYLGVMANLVFGLMHSHPGEKRERSEP